MAGKSKSGPTTWKGPADVSEWVYAVVLHPVAGPWGSRNPNADDSPQKVPKEVAEAAIEKGYMRAVEPVESRRAVSKTTGGNKRTTQKE